MNIESNDTLYYSIPDIIRAYAISRPTLMKKIDTGEIYAIKYPTSNYGGDTFKYLIPESELVKLESCKKCEIVARETSQPNYYVDSYRKEQERRLFHELVKAERTKRARIVEKYKEYLQSERWEQKRQEAIRYYGGICNFCGTAINLRVHHINYAHLGNEPMSDLMLICDECHEKLHEQDIKKKSEQTS